MRTTSAVGDAASVTRSVACLSRVSPFSLVSIIVSRLPPRTVTVAPVAPPTTVSASGSVIVTVHSPNTTPPEQLAVVHNRTPNVSSPVPSESLLAVTSKRILLYTASG